MVDPDYQAVAVRLFHGWKPAQRGTKRWWQPPSRLNADGREAMTSAEQAAVAVLEATRPEPVTAGTDALLAELDELLG